MRYPRYGWSPDKPDQYLQDSLVLCNMRLKIFMSFDLKLLSWEFNQKKKKKRSKYINSFIKTFREVLLIIVKQMQNNNLNVK